MNNLRVTAGQDERLGAVLGPLRLVVELGGVPDNLAVSGVSTEPFPSRQGFWSVCLPRNAPAES